MTCLVRSELYGIVPNDPLSIAAATVLLAAVSLLAGYILPQRPTRIDPLPPYATSNRWHRLRLVHPRGSSDPFTSRTA